MSEWRKYRLEDVVRLKRGFDLATPSRKPGPFPVVGSAGVSGWHDEGPIDGPAVVLGRAGASMGVASYCDVNRFWPLNTALFVEDFLGNDPRFIFYLFKVTDLTGFNSGSVQLMLNRNYIRNVPVNIPTPSEQGLIAAILGALDEKIAVNDRVAGTAEGLALALGSDERWITTIPLVEIVDHIKEQVLPDTLTVGYVAHYSIPAFDSMRLPYLVPPRSIKSSKFRVDGPSVLMSKLNPVIPRVWNVEPSRMMPALASTEFLVLRPRLGISADELWVVCGQPGFISTLTGKVTGTSNSHQRVKPDDLLATKVVDPRYMSDQVRASLSAIARLVYEARIQSRSLAELRDTLLPRLMSGEIRMREAERIVEDVT